MEENVNSTNGKILRICNQPPSPTDNAKKTVYKQIIKKIELIQEKKHMRRNVKISKRTH